MELLTLEDLNKLKEEGQEIHISHWTKDEKIIIKIRTLDISKELLMENSPVSKLLQPEVIEKFRNKKKNEFSQYDLQKEDTELIKNMLGPIDEVVKQVLIQPTFEQFEATVPLNMLQKIEIFEVVTSGIQKLKKNNQK